MSLQDRRLAFCLLVTDAILCYRNSTCRRWTCFTFIDSMHNIMCLAADFIFNARHG